MATLPASTGEGTSVLATSAPLTATASAAAEARPAAAVAAEAAAAALGWTEGGLVNEGSEVLENLQKSSETVAFIIKICESNRYYQHFKYVPGASHNSFERFCFGDEPDSPTYKGGDKNTGLCEEEQWRHRVYSYGLMEILSGEFNGNKCGPVGCYASDATKDISLRWAAVEYAVSYQIWRSTTADRLNAVMVGATSGLTYIDSGVLASQAFYYTVRAVAGNGAVGSDSTTVAAVEMNEKPEVVFRKTAAGGVALHLPTRPGHESLNYVGHNIASLAVNEFGEIVHSAFNHNSLFCSTTEHAEARLVDQLYTSPALHFTREEAFAAREEAFAARPFVAGGGGGGGGGAPGKSAPLEITDKMKRLTIYTSLESCIQCSGKLILAEVPQVVFLQKDPDWDFVGQHLFHKNFTTRHIPGPLFDFTPYSELEENYVAKKKFTGRVFWQAPEGDEWGAWGEPKKYKAGMPYFLCTDDAKEVFEKSVHGGVEKIFVAEDQADAGALTGPEVAGLLESLPLGPGWDAVKQILSELMKSALPSRERYASWVKILSWTPAANLAQTRNLECKLWCKRMELVNIKYESSKVVHVRNLPLEYSPTDLVAFFADLGVKDILKVERKRAPSGSKFANSVVLHFGSPLQAKWAAKTLAPDRLHDWRTVEPFDFKDLQYLADEKDVNDVYDEPADGVSWTLNKGAETPLVAVDTSADAKAAAAAEKAHLEAEAAAARADLRKYRLEAEAAAAAVKATSPDLTSFFEGTNPSTLKFQSSGGGGDSVGSPLRQYVSKERTAVMRAMGAEKPFCRLMSQYLESNAGEVLRDILETEKALNALLEEEKKRKYEETKASSDAGSRAVPRRVLNNAEVFLKMREYVAFEFLAERRGTMHG